MRKLAVLLMITAYLAVCMFTGIAFAAGEDNSSTARDHWAEPYFNVLDSRHNISAVMKNFTDYDKDISAADLSKLVDVVLQADYTFDSTSRETVVNTLVDILAQKAGIDLDEVLFVALVPFEDFGDINAGYTRNIMYAYSSGLINGSENKFFKPQQNVTYAEAIVLTSRIESMIANSSFYVTADVIKQGNCITFSSDLVNKSGQKQHLTFPSSQLFEVEVMDMSGNTVYRYSDQGIFAQFVNKVEVGEGESLHGEVVWDMSDGEGNCVLPGHYIARITYVPMEISKPEDSGLSIILNIEI